MPAKYLHALGEERRPELHRQIGCVTGILQAFDRRYPIAAHHHKRLLPPGNALSSSPSVGEERTRYGPQIVLDKNLSRSWIENQRASSTVELSQTSYSSSSCSSFSSLDGNRSTQQDLSSTDRMLFPEKPFKSSPRLKSSPDSDYGPDYYPDGTLIEPSDMSSAQSSHRTLGIRNLVKDSIYKDTHDLSIRISSKEAVNDHRYNYGDSATRFVEPPSSCNQGKSKGTMDVNESLRVLAKLRESSWNPSESSQQQRLSYDAPRFSYDGRESTSKLREMPRLSLDIKEGPLRTCEMDMRPKESMNAEERTISSDKEVNAEIQQEQPACKRLPSVVAKLMGLEELPERNDSKATTSQASISVQERKQEPILIPLSLSSHNEPARRQQRILDATIRNVPNSKFPAESAPWKQQERIVLPRKLPKGSKGAHGKEQPAASVYSEIEKRLNDLDFQHSNKDLRALKQILDSMQAKGLLQSKRREEASMLNLYDENYNSQAVTDVNHRLNTNPNPNQMSQEASSPSVEEESVAERFFKSPIVIMKPAKSADLGDEDSSVVPLGGLSDLTQPRTVNSTDKKKISRINRATIGQHPKSSPRVPASQPLVSPDGKANGRNEMMTRRQKSSAQLMTESSSRKQQAPRDNNGSFSKHKNSSSTRLPQKKLEVERRARPPIPYMESNKNQRQSADRSHLDTVSPRSKIRRKLAQGEDGHQNGAKSRARSLNQPGDDMSTKSEGSMSVISELDIEVTSADRSAEANALSFQRGNQTPPGRNPQKVKTCYDANKDLSSLDPAASIPERPSPVSVLDSSFDQENSFCTSKTTNSPNVDDEWHPSEESLKHCGPKPANLAAQPGNNKFANVASLLQKLQQLTVHKDDDEAPPVDHIAFLCEAQIPDHRYVSEILLASGLLMKDLSSGLSQIQLHASGYPVNPDLFLVLEQRKSGWISKPDSVHQSRRSDDPKRAHRKLMFDAVNSLLLQKYEKETSAHSTSSLTRVREVSSGQQLVKAICSEIEHLKTERSRMCHEDSSSVIPDADILHRLEGWTTSFGRQQLPGMVLEIERSIFKELVDEVVRGESADGAQAKAGRRGRRRLFT
ncbi:protein LONGIFOLIA 1 [Lolium perenne]|uniref:protein LONGIFOLIA 1 n=1 Tax=Lolium perenne TaxID=4522 RepID=UPI0021F5A8AE|nr:protein LONGIFOLIA 1-like [Lolium perenne]